MKGMVKRMHVLLGLLVGFLFALSGYALAADAGSIEINSGYDFRIISPGETQFVDVETWGYILNGDMHILNLTVFGSGSLGIAMERSDTGGDLIMMAGIAFSFNGVVVPIFRVGFTPNGISQAVDIGDATIRNGFVFLMSGVLFSLGGVTEEGGYSIELALE